MFSYRNKSRIGFGGLLLLFLGSSCMEKPTKVEAHKWIDLEVTASAFNSVYWQTDGQPSIAAWGDTLKPGMKAIAVSRDLLSTGMSHNTMVRIDTLPDTFYVKDKMHRKWKNRIDIYMGTDVKKARRWGKKKLTIQYAQPIGDAPKNNTR